jgi:N-acetylglucosamine-6-sulfatase
MFGKFINGYGDDGDPGTWKHPSVAEWWAILGQLDDDTIRVSVNGDTGKRNQRSIEFAGPKAEAFVREGANRPEPWFCYLAPTEPHVPHTPAPQYEHSHDGERLVTPATEETDLSDKSKWTRNQGSLSYAGTAYEGQREELEEVQDRTVSILNTLAETGQLGNTVVVITSDNGYMLGEHGGMGGKQLPHDSGVRVPFQAILPGHDLPESLLVNRLDATATVLHAAGAMTSHCDGRPLQTQAEGWRRRVLAENPRLGWRTMREGDHYYLKLPSGEEEMYDLANDPYELESLPKDGNRDLYDRMRAASRRLARAGGEDLRAAEET